MSHLAPRRLNTVAEIEVRDEVWTCLARSPKCLVGRSSFMEKNLCQTELALQMAFDVDEDHTQAAPEDLTLVPEKVN